MPDLISERTVTARKLAFARSVIATACACARPLIASDSIIG